MVRRRRRSAIPLLPILPSALAVAVPNPVLGSEDRQWMAVETRARPAILYGTPNSNDVVVEFACPEGTGMVEMTLAYEPIMVGEGAPITLEIAVDNGHNIVLQGTGERLLIDDTFLITARTPLVQQLQYVFTEQEVLSIVVEDGTIDIPIEGAAAAGSRLLSACES